MMLALLWGFCKYMGSNKLKICLGAYAASPSFPTWDISLESKFFSMLRKRDWVGGIEFPCFAYQDPFDMDWFLSQTLPQWDISITTLPLTMNNLSNMPDYGLASSVEDSRQRAVNDMHAVCKIVQRLKKKLGNTSVVSVQIVSAPTRFGNALSFYVSLKEILTWPWGDTKILVEHCDAFKPQKKFIKGFLSLPEEIQAIQSIKNLTGSQIGILLNWGRSVVEGETIQTILDHIRMARDYGLLRGFIFSGTTAKHDSPYGYFGDRHAPLSTPLKEGFFCQESLLTTDSINCVRKELLGCILDLWGIKFCILPLPQPLEKRLEILDYAAEHIGDFFNPVQTSFHN